MKNKTIDLCVSSPLSRTYETAEIIVDNKCKIITDTRLIERGFGQLEGKDISCYDSHSYWNYQLNMSDQGVESIQTLFKRVSEFYQDLKNHISIMKN